MTSILKTLDQKLMSQALLDYSAACVDTDMSAMETAGNALFAALEDLCAQAASTAVVDYANLTGAANFIKCACHSAARDAGWWRVPAYGETLSNRKDDIRGYPPHILQWWIGTKIALMHSELSEALEGERKDKMDDHLPHLKSRDVEFADAIIRIMDLCGGLGIDIGRAITEKLAYNARREDHKAENRAKAGGKAF